MFDIVALRGFEGLQQAEVVKGLVMAMWGCAQKTAIHEIDMFGLYALRNML